MCDDLERARLNRAIVAGGHLASGYGEADAREEYTVRPSVVVLEEYLQEIEALEVMPVEIDEENEPQAT
jgi:hypothetical protein